MSFASWGPLGRPLGGLLGRLGGLLGRLGIILGVQGRSFVGSGRSWIVWTDSGAALGRFGALVGERTVPEAHARNPGSAQERPVAPKSARESGGVGP